MNRDGLVQLIGSHALWRSALRKALNEGHFGLDACSVLDDGQCELGVWLSHFAGSELADDIQQAHAAHLVFHALAAQIVRLIEANRNEDAQLLLAPEGRFFHASADLIRILNQIQNALPASPQETLPEYRALRQLERK